VARLHGSDLSLLDVDDSSGATVSLLAETLSLNFSLSADTHDTTTIGDDWHEFTAGLKGGDEISHECFYNNSSGALRTYLLYTSRLGLAGTLSFGDGVRTTAMETIVTKVSKPVQVADMVKLTASHKITGAVTIS
jgi:hypothetical protein